VVRDGEIGTELWRGRLDGRAARKAIPLPGTKDCVVLLDYPNGSGGSRTWFGSAPPEGSSGAQSRSGRRPSRSSRYRERSATATVGVAIVSATELGTIRAGLPSATP